ncbi:MAG: Uma2 family endonuclease [Pirellulaceae bacterium]
MSTVLGKSQFTPADVLSLSGDERFELADGQLVRKEMSALAAVVASRINRRLGNIVEPQALGTVFTSDASYRCFPEEPDRVRRPDVSFIDRSRMRPEYLEGHVPIAPDLAVEVASQSDLFIDVRRKAGEYVRAGVRLVWIVNPEEREIQVFRANGTYLLVQNGDSLDGEDVVPGFRCPLAEIFQPPPMAGQ